MYLRVIDRYKIIMCLGMKDVMASDSEDDYSQKIDGDTVAENIAQSITNILVESTNEDFKQALHGVTQSRSSEEFKNTMQTRLDTFLEADAKRIASARLSKQYVDQQKVYVLTFSPIFTDRFW